MSNAKFYLKDNKSTKPTAIQLRKHINGKLFRYGIGMSIYPKLWDFEKQRPITAKKTIRPFVNKDPEILLTLENINTRIDNTVRVLQKKLLEYEITEEVIDFSSLKAKLDTILKLTIKKEEDKSVGLSLNNYISKYIKDLESGKRTYTTNNGDKRKYQYSTIKNYLTFKNEFALFQESIGRILNFKDIDITIYNEFVDYFSVKGYLPNSIGNKVKILKAILNSSFEEDLHSNTAYQRKDFRTINVEVDEVYLTLEEVTRLHDLDLSKNSQLEISRDIFLCGVWTAQRFSDYSRINKTHIKKRDGYLFLEMISKKTSEKVTIPLKPELVQILKKYDYTLPRIYEQKFNKRIKEVCRLAEIDETITKEYIIKGDKVRKTYKKHELIKSHSARRTGCSLMYLANIPTIDIMKISGHRNEKNLLKYIRVSKEETADRLKTHEYFK
jgi:integrase